MAKITAKHFLNTNLKPYIINKDKHYSVYISLVAFRKNTKVKSITFDEYYSENTFNEIITSNDKFDINLVENEINTITLITDIIINLLNDFDTAFITSYFKFSSLINIDSSIESEKYLLHRSKKINDVEKYLIGNNYFDDYFKIIETREIDFNWRMKKGQFLDITFIDSLKEKYKNITIFDFYNQSTQAEFLNYTRTEINSNNITEFITEYNKCIFLNSLKRFEHYIEKTKNSFLIEKYSYLFERE